MTPIVIEDQHSPFTFRLFVCVIIEVDQIFHIKALIRISCRASSKKGLVFEVVFEVSLG